MSCAQAQAKIKLGWDKAPHCAPAWASLRWCRARGGRRGIASSEPERLSVGRLQRRKVAVAWLLQRPKPSAMAVDVKPFMVKVLLMFWRAAQIGRAHV